MAANTRHPKTTRGRVLAHADYQDRNGRPVLAADLRRLVEALEDIGKNEHRSAEGLRQWAHLTLEHE